MATKNEEAAQALETIKNFDVSNLGRKEDLGKELSFESSQESAEKVVELFNLIPSEILSSLPENKANQLKKAAEQAVQVFNDVLAFSSKQENPANAHQQLTKQVSGLHNSIFDQLQPTLVYVNAQNPSVSQFEESLEKANVIVNEIEKKREETERVIDNIRAAAAETGVVQEATHFKDEADTHYGAAAIWLTITAISTGVLLLFVCFGSSGSELGAIFKRLSIIVALAAIALFCARNYASSKHNEVVNRHRQNSLLSFNAMVDAAKTDGARDIVLQQMSTAILNPQDTGYTKSKRGESANSSALNYPPYRIVERVVDGGTTN